MSTHVAPPVNEGPALDPEIFAGLLELVDEDDDSFVVDLFGSYVTSYAECIEGVARALATSDPDGLRHHAHTLKGASANVGASHLASLAEHLQRLGESGRVEPAEEWVEAIADEYVRVITEVETRVPGFRA
ncbi:MAG TPA: Hpt domain-containing protein [Candidatus Krumholzibacteria bacterium]|nr:Hpt domain-containing protein [Candidatus Krumholzibacteria bacterium]